MRPTLSPLLQSLRRKRQSFLNLGNRQRRIQSLRTSPAAVENRVAPVDTHAVVQCVVALRCLFVTAVRDPTVRLQEDGRTQVLFAVPPVGRA